MKPRQSRCSIMRASCRFTKSASTRGRTSRFLIEDILIQAEPEKNAVGSKVTLREVIDRAARTVGTRFHDQPMQEALLRETIAQTYHGLAEFGRAEPRYRRALQIRRERLGAEDRASIRATAQLGHVLIHLGKMDEGERLVREGLEASGRLFGETDHDTAAAYSSLARILARRGPEGLREAEALHRKITPVLESEQPKYRFITVKSRQVARS